MCNIPHLTRLAFVALHEEQERRTPEDLLLPAGADAVFDLYGGDD